jgi:hypothetical protein
MQRNRERKMTRTLVKRKVKPVTIGKKTYHNLIGNSGLRIISELSPGMEISERRLLSITKANYMGHSKLSTMRKWSGQFKNEAQQPPPLFCFTPIGCGEFSQVWGQLGNRVPVTVAGYGTPKSASTSGHLQSIIPS